MVRDIDDGKNTEKMVQKAEGKATVSIKYGDVMVSISSDDSSQAKQDAIEIFSMLEEKYSAHWGNKVCRERTRYD